MTNGFLYENLTHFQEKIVYLFSLRRENFILLILIDLIIHIIKITQYNCFISFYFLVLYFSIKNTALIFFYLYNIKFLKNQIISAITIEEAIITILQNIFGNFGSFSVFLIF